MSNKRKQFYGLLSSAVIFFTALCVPAGDSVSEKRRTLTGGVQSPSEAMTNYRRAADYSRRFKGEALVVMTGGKIVFEDYGGKGGPEIPHRLASGTKTFWGVLAMAAVQDGLLSLDENVSDTITEWKADPNKSRIIVRQLLNFTSGLDPAIGLLRGKRNTADKFRRILELRTVDAPGRSFGYGPSHLFAFGLFLQRKLAAVGKNSNPVNYLNDRVLRPIGCEMGRWREDKAGNPAMPFGAHVAPRQWIKFGELINKGGVWQGRSIIRADLLDEIFKGSKANPAYGLTLWLNKDAKGSQASSVADGVSRGREGKGDDGYMFRDGPQDLVMAAGKGKQRMYVIPSMDMVVVRFGESKGGWLDKEFLAILLQRLTPSVQEVPSSPQPLGITSTTAIQWEGSQDWQVVCATDIENLCPDASGKRRALRRCFRKQREQVSEECRAAVRRQNH